MDGLELLRKIRDKEIEIGTRFIDSDGNEYRYDEDEGGYPMVKQKDNITGDEYEPSLSMFTDRHTEFTILEKIDIQSIPEFEPTIPIDADNLMLIGIINRLVKAVKNLDKRLGE